VERPKAPHTLDDRTRSFTGEVDDAVGDDHIHISAGRRICSTWYVEAEPPLYFNLVEPSTTR
jgi:hypothetical protein